ncbi:riboflavin synthase subunit alpha [Labrys miyagiensis]|uniref:Riboflavin synthase n=1 Tax=Labrys miyagiensis TaxID=346912 RepID=A0ABQ6CM04_9HYPH|nr:riboflavin synthase [Labrys miyagiensis]GLS21371.1 riboflavin synthase subunit alpha [Labrys miyagiensis]
MFTGIITDIGEIISLEDHGSAKRIAIACGYPLDSIAIGASIANAGVCLTVTTLAARGNKDTVFTIDASSETIERTTMGAWQVGDKVNLERALRIGDELGGHIVSGHIDGIAEIVSRKDQDGTSHFVFRAPAALSKFIAQKGSVALNGTSLTVNHVEGDDFSVMMIPHTLAVTTWGDAKVGDKVNIEIDTMARYAARLADVAAGR